MKRRADLRAREERLRRLKISQTAALCRATAAASPLMVAQRRAVEQERAISLLAERLQETRETVNFGREGLMELERTVQINAALNRKRELLLAERARLDQAIRPHTAALERLEASRRQIQTSLESVKDRIRGAKATADQSAIEEVWSRWQE